MSKLTRNKKKGSFPRKMSKKTPKKTHYNIVYCTPGRKLPDTFPYILSESLNAGFKCAHVKTPYNANVYVARAQCLGNNALNANIHRPLFENKFTYDYIVFIDEDNAPTFEQVKRLLSHNTNIVAGLYHMKCRDKFAAVEKADMRYFEKHGNFQFLTDKDIEIYRQIAIKKEKPQLKNFLLPVFYTGFGCIVIKQGVFEKIGYPYFLPEFLKLSNKVVDLCSEDVSFCIRAKKAGFQPYVDIGVIFPHEKNYLV
jgi:stalled ribosome alternative rescue factor ArfA